MPTPSEKLADSLEILHGLQASGNTIIRSADLTRTHRERLLQNVFCKKLSKVGIYQHAQMKHWKTIMNIHRNALTTPNIRKEIHASKGQMSC